jgi:hypothetical protein
MKNWNLEIGKMPEFDGEYLCKIHQKQECGVTWEFQMVITQSYNQWLIPSKDWEVIAWKELDKNPSEANKIFDDLIDTLSGLVSDVGNLLSENDIEWQQSGYYNHAKELLLKLKK